MKRATLMVAELILGAVLVGAAINLITNTMEVQPWVGWVLLFGALVLLTPIALYLHMPRPGQDEDIDLPRTPTPASPTTAPIIPSRFNLPADLPDFTGRQAELDKVREALSREGAVAIGGIHGMGGIGKTALALHVAHQLAAEGRFGDAQLYIDLKGADPDPVDSAAALQSLTLDLLGPDPQRPDDVDALSDLWRRAIHGKDAVLILDNAADAPQVRPLLPGCPTCAVLITSRRRFTLPGAGRLDLDPMDPADARAMLQRLAPRLGDDSADAIARLCGHLPLALRIAGNYLHLNDDASPDRYAALLTGERGRLARLRDPDDPDLDVEATITLSVAQLDDETRRAWALLSLFPAPFDLAAAAALWEQPDESTVLERLHVLRNRSLVAYDADTDRYDQHDLLRLAAARELEDSAQREIPAARDRLALHYLAVAEQVKETQIYLDLDPDWPHLRAAFDYASKSKSEASRRLLVHLVSANDDYLLFRTLLSERARWFEHGIVCARQVDNKEAEAEFLDDLGEAYRHLAGRQKAIDYHAAALAIAQEIGDRTSEQVYLGNLANAYADRGQIWTAIEHYEAALEIAREIGDRLSEGFQLDNLGTIYSDMSEYRKSIEHHEAALAIAQETGSQRFQETCLGNLGACYGELGETRRAIEYLEAGLAIAQKMGNRQAEGIHLGNLAGVYTMMGKVRTALEQFEAALEIAREIGDQRAQANQLLVLGQLYATMGNLDRARDSWNQAIDGFAAIDDPAAELTRRLLDVPGYLWRIEGWITRLGLQPALRRLMVKRGVAFLTAFRTVLKD